MKPKRIELEGFTAYRKRTPIDFEEADLFVIVGATGSGKSSIIDAMIFALYGSVPRFDDQKLVQPVISQGMNEARVCFHFALDGNDYAATRIVRRSASDPSKASTKEARLESGGDVIASGAPEVTQAVVDRLGLTFDQFTRCVVLPQGAFARFLHDKPKARQDLLNRLLGLDLYERLAARARDAERDARAGAEAYETQAAGLAEYTATREREAEAHSKSVAALAARFRTERASTEKMAQEAQGLDRDADEDDADRKRLAEVTKPREMTALVDRRDALEQERRSAGAALERARSAVETAERRREALGELAPLVKLQGLFGQLAEKRGRVATERLRLDQVTEEAERHEAALRESREQRSRLGDIEPLLRRQGLLRELAATREDLAAAAVRRDRAQQELDDARDARAKADAAVEALGDVDALIGLRDLFVQLQANQGRLIGAEAELDGARARAEQARRESTEAEQAEREARGTLDRMRAEHYAHALRLELRPGETCPVCDQEVTVPPAAQAPAGLQDAERALTAATERRDEAAGTRHREAQAEARAEQAHASLVQEVDRARKQTAASEAESPAEVDDRIEAAKTARDDAQQAGNRYARAQSTLTAARDQQQALERKTADFGRRLRDGWTGPAPSDAEIDERINSIREAETRLDEARAEHDAANTNLAGVRTGHDTLVDDVAMLENQTKDAPAPAEIDTGIAAIHSAEARLKQTREEQRAAAERLDRCDRDRAALVDEEQVLWERLDKVRVSVIRHGPPEPDRQAGLGSSWDAMTTWAGKTATALQERIAIARERAKDLAAQRRQRLTEYLTALAELGVEVESEPDAAGETGIGERLAASREQATAALDTVREKRRGREALEERLRDARKREAVAGRLATLLGARAFQRWRLTGAFARLVAGASRWLRDLSAAGYSLTHTPQMGFEVIDHANADEQRSVRTLSGGETFLASLSLALALADQVADLASTGAARLESMFLDEGFGSLDPETLDTVAAALEELGATGRTLGIVTHVPALAERVPIQFRVTKDAATARVERVAS